MTKQFTVNMRWLIRRDMQEVKRIEFASFEFPWFEEDFVRCLRLRNCIGMVAEGPGFTEKKFAPLAGFFVYEMHKTRLHVLNFAVAPEFRRQGVGRQMVEKLTGKLSEHLRTRIFLEVRETNLDAQLFFQAMGFRAINVLRSYYEDSPEAAYVMCYRHEPECVATETDQTEARPR